MAALHPLLPHRWYPAEQTVSSRVIALNYWLVVLPPSPSLCPPPPIVIASTTSTARRPVIQRPPIDSGQLCRLAGPMQKRRATTSAKGSRKNRSTEKKSKKTPSKGADGHVPSAARYEVNASVLAMLRPTPLKHTRADRIPSAVLQSGVASWLCTPDVEAAQQTCTSWHAALRHAPVHGLFTCPYASKRGTPISDSLPCVSALPRVLRARPLLSVRVIAQESDRRKPLVAAFPFDDAADANHIDLAAVAPRLTPTRALYSTERRKGLTAFPVRSHTDDVERRDVDGPDEVDSPDEVDGTDEISDSDNDNEVAGDPEQTARLASTIERQCTTESNGDGARWWTHPQVRTHAAALRALALNCWCDGGDSRCVVVIQNLLRARPSSAGPLGLCVRSKSSCEDTAARTTLANLMVLLGVAAPWLTTLALETDHSAQLLSRSSGEQSTVAVGERAKGLTTFQAGLATVTVHETASPAAAEVGSSAAAAAYPRLLPRLRYLHVGYIATCAHVKTAATVAPLLTDLSFMYGAGDASPMPHWPRLKRVFWQYPGCAA